MQKTLALLLSGSLLIVGCGKKSEHSSKKAKSKNVASLNKDGEIPLLLNESQSLLNDDADMDFAFVDAEEGLFDNDAQGNTIASAEHVDGNKKSKKFNINLNKEGKGDQELAANLGLDDESFDRVQFNFNKNDIRQDQTPVVKKDIALAKKAVAVGKEVVVAGHTCQIGSASYNVALSQKRAETVKKEMMKEGIPAEKVKTLGLGYESPLVWSDSANRVEKIKDLAPNRRAEVNIA